MSKVSKSSTVNIAKPHKGILESYELEVKNVKNGTFDLISLRILLDQYHVELANASAANEFIDLKLANQLHQRCTKILDYVETSSQTEATTELLALVAYFVNSNDAADDFHTIDGFEDDLEIMEYVLYRHQLQDVIG